MTKTSTGRPTLSASFFDLRWQSVVTRVAVVLAMLFGVASAATAETLLMPPRDMLASNVAQPTGPGPNGEVVWGVTTLPNFGVGGATTTYDIDFGDSTPHATGNVTDRSYIAVNHVFQATGDLTVTLTVTNGGVTETATTVVRVFNGGVLNATAPEQLRGVNVNRAIENGLRYLWTQQVSRGANFPDGPRTSWPGSYPEVWAALVVLAFENHGYKLPNDDTMPTGLYEKYIVRRGMNYIVDGLETFNITLQGPAPASYNACVGSGAGPDPDGAGAGLCVGLVQNDIDAGYASSIAILPLAGSNALNRHMDEAAATNALGSQNNGYVKGKTLGEILQRTVNGLAWGQGESGFGRGGWNYGFNAGSTDGSTMGWNLLALLDAEASGITIPAFMKSEVLQFAIPFGLNTDGTYDYTPENNPAIASGGALRNMAKAGIGGQALFYAGVIGLGNSQVVAMRNSISARWTAPVSGQDTHSCDLFGSPNNKGCAYAMFNVFKALKLHNIQTIPAVTRPAGPGDIPAGDWYADYVDWLLTNQASPTDPTRGDWPSLDFSCCDSNSAIGSVTAAMAELILSPVALIAPDPSLFSTVGLSPATALRSPFGTHTVTATATSAGGAAVPGATINFQVLTGLNAGKNGSGVTDSNGQVSFTYTDTGGPGKDTIRAFIGTLGSNTVEVIWSIPDCSPTGITASLSSPIFPIDQGWRGVTINGAPGAKVTQVCQDEAPNFENIPAWAIDADGVGTSNASIRAQRSGTRTAPGNGRVYTVFFTAGACKGSVKIEVPGAVGGRATDDGARYDSVTGAACAAPPVPAVTQVPDVVGQSQANATATLAGKGLALGAVSQINHPTIPYGQVISQLPQAGANVAQGSAVAVTVSSGPASVAVPNVLNLPQSSATSLISGATLTPSVTTVNSNSVAAGLVISQSIPGGTQVPPGTAVLLTVSLGKATSTVPNVVGLPLAGAVSTVGGAGLNFGNVNLVYSSSVPDGIVMSQSPPAGTVLPPGSLVDFDISQGPQPVPVPNLAGMNESQAAAAIIAAQLQVGNVVHDHHPTVPDGLVSTQSPAAGALLKPGSDVAFAISTGPVMVFVPNVANDTEVTAKNKIVAEGLAVGTIAPINHPTVPAGLIIGSVPAAGQKVPLGSSVAMTLSLGPTPVLVPSLLGLNQAGATGALTAATLVAGNVTFANSPTVPSGNVMGQNPLAGSSVLPGTAVNFVVSNGPVIVTVPNVIGDTQAVAQTKISGANLFLQQISFITNPAPAGQVIAQTPNAGASAVLGSVMTITVSLGSNSVTVPNVIGKTQANAGATLIGADLVVGTVTQTAHPNVPAGTVIDQSPLGSTVASQGSGVNLLVSTGPTSVIVPDVVSKTEPSAVGDLLGAHLGVLVTYDTSSLVDAGRVISQNPVAGSQAGEGSTVTIKVSTGVSPAVPVPNLIGQVQGDATTLLTNAGLQLGSVTQQSSAQAVGKIVGQTPTAGSTVPGNTQVNIVVSTGPEAGVPAFLNLNLSSQVLGGGASSNITASVLDGFSVPIVPTPGIVYEVIAGEGASGSAPYVTGNQLFTSANTLGAYVLRGTVSGTVVTDDVPFSVLDGSAASKNAAKFVKLGTAEQTVKDKIDALLQAYQNLAPASDVTNAKAALSAALATVPITGPTAMQRSTAVALPHGFLPELGTLLSIPGFALTAQDAAFGNLIDQIAEKLQEIEAFYGALNPDALAGGANSVSQLNALNSQLQALVDQLGALNPSPAGVVKYAPQLNRLLGHTIPEHLHAVTNKVIAIANQYPDPTNLPNGVARLTGPADFFAELNARRQALTPGAFYDQTQPAFFGLVGLMAGCSLQMDLVNRIYGPILWEVSDMISVLIANGIFQNYVSSASIGDIVSGASLSFHIPFAGGSQIEGYGFDRTSAAGNETFFIGTEAFSLVRDLITSFDPSEVESIQDVWDFFEGIANAVNASFAGYENAHTQGDEVYPGGCILDDNPGCTALVFNSGFPDVTTGRFPSPVIIILHNTNNGSWSSGMFNFIP